ncbi:MAG: hypothetical protein U1F64_14725 [Burkholderiales bacterium]
MDAYSPDLASHWTTGRDAPDERAGDRDERRVPGDEEALADLADRVLAARSVV